MRNNLQKLRWEKGWSQQKLARKSGVKQQTISVIENNQACNPSIRTALKLARALKVPVDKIFKL